MHWNKAMYRRTLSKLGLLNKARLIADHFPWKTPKNINIMKTLIQGNSTLISFNKPTFIIPHWVNTLKYQEILHEIKFPKHSTVYSGLDIVLPSLGNITITSKLTLNFAKNITIQEQIMDIENEGKKDAIIWMGSLLKKRRRKMNRQKYKKRRKRDRFKREALKNLREKKWQRKERAVKRKEEILSEMVVNKSISKRRARFLSHKLLPGVIKGQGLG